MEAQETLFIKGFNDGYLLAKHEPELAAKLTARETGDSDYQKALVLGKQEFEKEVEQQQWAKSFSKGKSLNDRDLDKER